MKFDSGSNGSNERIILARMYSLEDLSLCCTGMVMRWRLGDFLYCFHVIQRFSEVVVINIFFENIYIYVCGRGNFFELNMDFSN